MQNLIKLKFAQIVMILKNVENSVFKILLKEKYSSIVGSLQKKYFGLFSHLSVLVKSYWGDTVWDFQE